MCNKKPAIGSSASTLSTEPNRGAGADGGRITVLRGILSHQRPPLLSFTVRSAATRSSARMKPAVHPPDAVLRAYADLLNQVFLFLRSRSHSLDQEELFDLADALHNIGGILADYGAWTDDENYRRLYLRPFDRRWQN